MKILKIEFRNINSLKGNHEIDFANAPFTTSSLFAITGPTGSGKSTILDVISLALFNKIPRLERVSKGEILKTGAILTRNQQDAMAAVTYESKNGKFRSEWNISTARTGNLREYEMQLSHGETGELMDLKKSEVPAKNENLIGLNYNQFIKSVLLAQGEFAQFLKAKKDERGELLEKITGTGIYRQLGKKSYEKFREVNREIETQQHRIAAIREQLLEEEQHGLYTEQLEQKNCDIKELEKKIEAFKKQLELKRKITQQLKEIKARELLKTKAETNLKTFEAAHGHPLKQHEKVEAFAEELRSWSLLKKEINSLEEEIKNVQKQEELNRNNRQHCLEKAGTLTGTEVTAENLSETLEDFRRKVSGLQQERREKGLEYSAVRNQLKREVQGLPFQLNEKDPEENRKQISHLKTASEEKINTFRRELDGIDPEQPEQEKERLTGQLELAREAWRKDAEMKNLAAETDRLHKEAEELAPKLKTYPAEVEIAKGKTEVLQERLEKFELKKQNQLLQASLEEHRHALKEGEPCPLCGALEHPYAKDLPEKDNTLDGEIAQTRKELDLWKHKLSTTRANLESCRERLAANQRQKEQLESRLEAGRREFHAKYGHLLSDQETADWQELCELRQQQIDLLQALQQEQKKLEAILAAIPLLKQLGELHCQGTRLKQELDTLYSGEDISADTSRLATQWTGLQQEQKTLVQQCAGLSEKTADKKKELVILKSQLLPEIRQQDFETIEQARGALIPEAECRRLRADREEIQKKIHEAKSSEKLLQTQLEESRKADVEAAEEELNSALTEHRQKHETTSGECRELYSHLKSHADNLKRLEETREEIAEKEKQIRRWRLLNELIGDATGKKFNDFAQDLSLSQLLQLANLRLKDLSDRYRIDKPGKDEDDALVAIDEHMGGQRRSVKTLSGGETFLLSLSMALALSDLASKNVEINSLFIDEGFGTLDPETLDQTLDTLEKLQAESSKTIGIISHVDSLKERIATQIQLRRNGQGYSMLEVRG